MRGIRKVEITCPKCSEVFPSPLKFTRLTSFLHAARLGFPAQCSRCYHLFDAYRTHMSVELEPDS